MSAMRRCPIHELPAENGRCLLRNCVRGSGRKFCPRHGVGFDREGRCMSSRPCDFTDGAITSLYHLAPASEAQTIARAGLTPAPARGASALPSRRQRPTGIPVYCDPVVAENNRAAVEAQLGPCQLWEVNVTDVPQDALTRDRTAASEALLITQPVPARLFR